jgi:hypothetical protein
MCTLFRSENAFSTYDEVTELRDVTGLAASDLVVFRPERLALHEVLIRVIADYEVPDPEGAPVRSLGINFRKMTQAIVRRHLAPRLHEIVSDYARLLEDVGKLVRAELAALALPASDAVAPRTARFAFWRRPRRPTPAPPVEPWAREERVIRNWIDKAQADRSSAVIYGALIRVVSAIRGRHGMFWGESTLLEPLISGLACNTLGAEAIGDRLAPLIAQAAAAEGFRPLPAQDRPIVMSTKGASASGKSTMRPMQRALAARMGANWGDFALISPDILRRDLLDIDSLGPHYKYFGTFTSHELEIVDRKLDRYLAQKAKVHSTPHLLVDRFRFDSFLPDSEEQRQLIARLGRPRLIQYLFMITPPHKTVERAWKRGLEVGRYKPVDDLLAHNVEAYTGMQSFFFARALRPGSLNQHYEFLDNDVPLGDIPLTVAFGWNAEMNILDVGRMLDFERYRRINVDARHEHEIYIDPDTNVPGKNVAFLCKCVREFPSLTLAERSTGRIYATLEQGRLVWSDATATAAIDDPVAIAALRETVPELFSAAATMDPPRFLDPSRFLTLGRWAERAATPVSSQYPPRHEISAHARLL